MKKTRELSQLQQLGLWWAGGGLLAATGAIHLDLYLTGYSSLSVIGPLFLLQVIAAFALAVAVLVLGSRPATRPAGRLAAAAGAGFALSTLVGYLLTVWIGLFGFREVRTTAGIVAGVIEIAAFAILAVLVVGPVALGGPAGATAAPGGQAGATGTPGRPAGPAAGGGALLARLPAGLQAGVPGAGWAVAAVSLVACIALGTALAGAGAPAPASAGGGLRAAKVGGATVVTNAKGFTLYWFVPDTRTKSNCNGGCAAYWPPVKGPVTAGPGVTGKIGTIRRDDGSAQATYNGRPLYTYIGDNGPGQARGNGINLNGGLWHEVTVSG
jgi:predicted lipoprotein with Yx(FWY)xxD motif